MSLHWRSKDYEVPVLTEVLTCSVQEWSAISYMISVFPCTGMGDAIATLWRNTAAEISGKWKGELSIYQLQILDCLSSLGIELWSFSINFMNSQSSSSPQTQQPRYFSISVCFHYPQGCYNTTPYFLVPIELEWHFDSVSEKKTY